MAEKAIRMLEQAIEAFTTEDSALARRVIEHDKEIDSIYRKVVRAYGLNANRADAFAPCAAPALRSQAYREDRGLCEGHLRADRYI